jgi:NosL.
VSEATCDVCGIVVADHPEPSAGRFYAENRPVGHANPAQFDSTREAFRFDFERGWAREALCVTNYATTATFVADSTVRDDGACLIGGPERAVAGASGRTTARRRGSSSPGTTPVVCETKAVQRVQRPFEPPAPFHSGGATYET